MVSAPSAACEADALNQYRAGTTDYTTVVVAQGSALSARQALITSQRDRITAAVQLIAALGGGWSTSQPVQVQPDRLAQSGR